MAGSSRVVRLAGDIDDCLDRLVEDASEVVVALSDGVVTVDEQGQVLGLLNGIVGAMRGFSLDAQIVADSHQLAKQALSSDGVTAWVVRSAREKGADYQRCGDGPGYGGNVIPFPDRMGEPKPAA